MTTNTQSTIDPWADANDAQEQVKTYFGEFLLDIYLCAVERGLPSFIPGVHDEDKRATAINWTVYPLTGEFTLGDKPMLKSDPQWVNVILPSLHALNMTPEDFKNKKRRWIKYEAVPVKWRNKKTGEEGAKKTPKILAFYETEEECRAAADAFYGKKQEEEQAFDHTAPATPGDLHPAANGNAPGNAAIEAFVNVLYGQAQGDLDRLEALIKGAGMDWNSKEVQVAVSKKTEEVPF